VRPVSAPEPRPAATLILLRHGAAHGNRGLEALMVRRNPSARFMPGAWVFPGGAVDDIDRAAGDATGDPDEAAHRACVRRELREEAGIELADDSGIWPWSRWITPEVVPVRFDTRFYVAEAPPHARPKADGDEVVAADWLAPAEALERAQGEGFDLAFPTIKHLEGLREYASAPEAVAAAQTRRVEPILPRVIGTREDWRVVLPGEPGY
jgi:8-oxo-dGTP pyrophosphatase MutT (NUDIX family)